MRRRRPSTALTATNAARARMHHRFAQLLLLLGARGCSALLVHGSAAAAARRLSRRGLTSDYVEELFDGFAESFEDQLALLEYAAPARIAEAARERSAARGAAYGPCLDAGCGTGLLGPPLLPSLEGPLVGADLSENMVARAEALATDDGAKVYDDLAVGDLNDAAFYDALAHGPYDLVAAADVLCYFGDLDTVLRLWAAHTAPGGDAIFSCERVVDDDFDGDWKLGPSGRYAHRPASAFDDRSCFLSNSRLEFTENRSCRSW